MEYKKMKLYELINDRYKLEVYKDIFFPDGAIMITDDSGYWHRCSIEEWLKSMHKYCLHVAFPIIIGRLGIANDLVKEYEGWKPLFWRFHWRLRSDCNLNKN